MYGFRDGGPRFTVTAHGYGYMKHATGRQEATPLAVLLARGLAVGKVGVDN